MALCKGCLETTSSLLAIYYANFHVGLKCFAPIDYVAHIEVNYRFLHQSHMLNFFLYIIFFYFRCIGDIISNIHSTRPHNFQPRLNMMWNYEECIIHGGTVLFVGDRKMVPVLFGEKLASPMQ